jgi:hypothetical protein
MFLRSLYYFRGKKYESILSYVKREEDNLSQNKLTIMMVYLFVPA